MLKHRALVATLSASILCASCGLFASSDEGQIAKEAEPQMLQSADAAEILFFAPVLEVLPPPCEPDAVSIDGGECLVLGSERLDSSVVESASVDTSGSLNTVGLVFTEEGIVRFNELATTCFTQDARCPTARIAIVSGILEGQVVSAPTLNAASFARDQVSISGNFDEVEAEQLATTLNG